VSKAGLVWQRVWEQVIAFFARPLEIRKITYTTNAIESLRMQLRKVLKNRGHFPNDEAATKLIPGPYVISPRSGKIRRGDYG
jgi:transposase-like protein